MSAPTFFASAERFWKWLKRHHASATELLVGYWKVDSGKPSMTWSESVDQALCFGWIDGVRRRRDAESYTIRFTPRRPGSNWSAINIAKVAQLEKLGLMRPAGRKAFAARLDGRSNIYSYEQRYHAALDPSLQKRFVKQKRAWAFFQKQPPSYRHTMIFWIASGKRAETRDQRLDRLIQASAAGKRVL